MSIKVKSVSGHTCQVRDLEKTVAFYEKLGLTTKVRDEEHATLYLNWYWIDFVVGKPNPKATIVPYLSVDDVDETHKVLVRAGITPESEPQTVGKNSVFMIRDPDGYAVTIFKRR